ncbi:SPT3 Dosage dependent suppressor of Ty-induced promoter mutations-like protein, partial [Dipsacomyces acuminosporus]
MNAINGSSAEAAGALNSANLRDYLKNNDNGNDNNNSSSLNANGLQQAQRQLLSPDFSALLMSATAATRSTPGSPSAFAGALGFNSVRTSPVLAPSLPQSPRNNSNIGNVGNLQGLDISHGFNALAALSQHQFGFDSAANSAVQSATASPTSGAFGRRNLLSGMANLNVSQLPPTSITPNTAFIGSQGAVTALGNGIVDSSGMFGSVNSAFTTPSIGPTGNALAGIQQVSMAPHQHQLTPNVSADFLHRVEEAKAKGLRIELDGIASENAKSRVETQIKVTLRLTTDDGERVTCWSHLALPEMLVSREKFRHRLQKQSQSDSNMPVSPQHIVHLEATIICSSDPTRKVETCIGCIRREYKRSLRRKDNRLRSTAPSACTTPAQSRPGSPTGDSPSSNRVLTGSMETDWDDGRIAVEKQRIVIFNCNDLLDFSKGELVLPTRITCYCRHHNEKVGFCLCLTLKDYQGNVLATHMSPPIMITDDHKSTKFKTDRKVRGKSEYDRLGDGSAAYANHALGSLGTPHSNSGSLHLADGSSSGGFKGGRQAMSARNSPTMRPYSHHSLLETYSQFASLAGTPSLGNTPLGSPLLTAANLTGFDTSFHLPQAATMAGNYQVSNGPSLFGNLAGSPNATHVSAAAAAAAVAAANQIKVSTTGTGLSPLSRRNSFNRGTNSVHVSPQTLLPMNQPLGNLQQQQQHQQQHQPSNFGLQQAAGIDGNLLFGGQSAFPQGVNSTAGSLMPQLNSSATEAVQITQLTPAQGPVAGGTSILISGRGFHPNMAVFFGSVQAGLVQMLSPSNITCTLPPTNISGPVPVRIKDMLTMTVYEANGTLANLQQPALHPGQQALFTYVEDTDQALIELALQVVRSRQAGQQQHQSKDGDKKPSLLGITGTGSAQVSPVMQNKSANSSRMSSPSSDNSSEGIFQKQALLSLLQSLRLASEKRNLMEIESCLMKLFMTLVNKNQIDASRLSIQHEASGRTLLHFCALLGMTQLCTFLATHGVILDATDNNGMTAMHFASMYGRTEIVVLLLDSGASHVIKSNLGHTAGDLARSLGYAQIQLLIEERDGYMSFIKDDQTVDHPTHRSISSISTMGACQMGEGAGREDLTAEFIYARLELESGARAGAKVGNTKVLHQRKKEAPNATQNTCRRRAYTTASQTTVVALNATPSSSSSTATPSTATKISTTPSPAHDTITTIISSNTTSSIPGGKTFTEDNCDTLGPLSGKFWSPYDRHISQGSDFSQGGSRVIIDALVDDLLDCTLADENWQVDEGMGELNDVLGTTDHLHPIIKSFVRAHLEYAYVRLGPEHIWLAILQSLSSMVRSLNSSRTLINRPARSRRVYSMASSASSSDGYSTGGEDLYDLWKSLRKSSDIPTKFIGKVGARE